MKPVQTAIQVPEPGTLTLPDGRRMGYATYGAPAGEPLLYLHGLPGSRLECLLIDAPARSLGICVIAVDRPGYGLSSPAQNSLSEWVDDIGFLLAERAWSDILVMGVSGGGPHALACAYHLPDRVKEVCLVAGLGPVSDHRLRKQMDWLSRPAFWMSKHAATALRLLAGLPLTWLAQYNTALLIRLLALINAPPDRACLNSADIHSALMTSLPECFRQGASGALADLQRVQADWTPSLEVITAPVRIWHGTADRVVPPDHSHYLAQYLQRSRLTIVPAEGHFSLPYLHMETILADLVDSRESAA